MEEVRRQDEGGEEVEDAERRRGGVEGDGINGGGEGGPGEGGGGGILVETAFLGGIGRDWGGTAESASGG